MAPICPFARLIPQLSIVPDSGGSSGSSSSDGGPMSPGVPMTPSFLPNSSADYLSSNELTVPRLIAAVSHQAPHPGLRADDIPLPEGLDLGLPISELLKIGTQRAHADAEHSEGAKELMKGTLGLEEYIRWNVILWRVYDALELALSEHYDHPVLAPTYDPRTLSRSHVLAQDITHLLTLLPPCSSSSTIPTNKLAAGLSVPLPPFPLPSFLLPVFTSPPPPLAAYIQHIRSLSSSASTASGLLAHAYVRYLGDMSGGQFIAARIKRSYGLKGAEGLRFFHFDQMGRSAEEMEGEGGGEARKRLGELKDWYRRGMNEGVGEDQALKAHLVKEANLAFALNTHLFSLIEPTPATSSQSTSKLPQSASEESAALSREQIRSDISAVLNKQPPPAWRGVLEKIMVIALALVVGHAMRNGMGPFMGIGEKLGVGLADMRRQ